jgi:iron complex outermembrane receptor protein
MGGAIFFWPRLPDETRASLGQGVGSFGERHHWGSIEVAGSAGALLASVHRAGADNDYPFVNDQGQRFDLDERSERRVNADYGQTDAWLLGRASLGRGARVHGVLHALDREQGVTGLSVVPARFARSQTRRLLAGHSVLVPCGAGGCRLELSSNLIAAESTLRDPFVELPALRTRRLDANAQRMDHALLAHFGNADHRLGLLVQGSFGRLEVDRVGNRPRRAARLSLSPRLTAGSRLSKGLDLGLLVGLECHSTSGLGVSLGAPVFAEEGPCHVHEPVGRLSARQAFGPQLDLIANVGRYVRLPSLSELYGSSPAVEGNSRLVPERGVSADLGLRHAFSSGDAGTLRTALEAFAFVRAVDGLIRYRRTGVETLTPFNVASARLLGVEAAGAAELWQALRLETSLTLVDPRETTDDPVLDPTVNDILPNTARLTLALGLRAIAADWPRGGGLERVELGARYLHRSSRFEDPAGQNVLPAQDFVDLDLALRFAGGHLLVRLACRNAFDWRGSDVIGLPVPGRSQHATAEGWF